MVCISKPVSKHYLNFILQGIIPHQLLLAIYGESGTGKSTVVEAILDAFYVRNAWDMITRRTYTEIKSLLIDTISQHPSPRLIQFVREDWEEVIFVVIEDCPTDDPSFFTELSHNLCLANDKPFHMLFGGINIIIAGDVIYGPANHRTTFRGPLRPQHWAEEMGREVRSQFTEVVLLRQPMRTVDPEWWRLLQDIRFGRMNPDSLRKLRSLVLPDCGIAKPLSSFHWAESTLITSNPITFSQWNTASLRCHSRTTGQPIYVCSAEDTVSGSDRVLNDRERFYVSRIPFTDMKQLSTVVHIAIGMPVMVCLPFVSPTLEEGAIARVVGVTLHHADTQTRAEVGGVIRLKRLPRSIQVQQNDTDNIVTLAPSRRTYHIQFQTPPDILGGGAAATTVVRHIDRQQYSLTGAYAITDVRARGESTCAFVVDISNSQSVKSVYTALSRSRSMDGVRFLYDFDNRLFSKGFDNPSDFGHRRVASMHEFTAARWELSTRNDFRYNHIHL